MLCLKGTSKPEWVVVANQHHKEILIDHAHCEKKAAGFAIAMINRYPGHAMLVAEMVELCKEEIDHFDMVNKELVRRGIKLTSDKGTVYVQELKKHVRTSEPERLLDLLVVGAFIEARSCERFSILSKHVTDPILKDLYTSLLASEAGHYTMYTNLAREYFPLEKVKQRISEFADIEQEIIDTRTNLPTMHG
ncbi:MAG: tRNA-(ms[2]io[6]A)-hydroxylase [Ignavibacteria bacterium]|nr:tRNA-(ms[2]io[6]A)-hydroxylase [Ignavibacteria bacterium]